MNFVTRQRTAIELPSRRIPAFAMAGENGVEALMAQFGAHHEAVTQRFCTIEAELERVTERMAGLTALGTGSRPSGESNLRTELNAVAKFFRSKGRQQDELLNIHTGAVTALANIQGAMSVGSDPDGGYLVLPEISKSMTKKLWDVSAMRRICRVETVTGGVQWEEPIDPDQVGSGWVGETDPRAATSTPKIGMLKIPLNEAYAQPPITQSLLDSSQFDLGNWLIGKINDKFGRDEGIAFIGGDGVNKPMGLLSYPQSTASDATRPWGTLQTVATGQAGAFPTSNPADPLKNLLWSLRAPYRAGASWLMNSNTLSLIDKMKDGQGNYLLRPGLTAGMPDMLLGYPVAVDDVAMPDPAANSISVAFGNFQLGYVIVDRLGIKLLVDPFTAKPLVLYYAYRRVGGGLANSEAIKLLKFA
ncbi:phage major capsid protein [Bradyrhizobium sp.]|uniref:phage major capsid protein n=1 Tax=Bradyrhizobium sp. TaxID=376 RepID=UPI0039E5ABC6